MGQRVRVNTPVAPSAAFPLWLDVLSIVVLGSIGLWSIHQLIRRGRAAGKPRIADTHQYPRRSQWIPAAVAVALLLALVAVALDVNFDGLISRTFDLPMHDYFIAHRTPWLTSVVIVITNVFGPAGATILAAVAAGFFAVRTRSWIPAVVIFLGPALSGLLVRLSKFLVPRQRPDVAGQAVITLEPSFPSGHATGIISLTGCILVVLFAGFAGPLSKAALRSYVLAAVVLSVLVGWTRLYLGVHWFTDIVAGWILGGIAVTATVAIYRMAQMRTGRADSVRAQEL